MLSSGNGWTYSWNAENRLEKAVNAGGTWVTYEYDHLGRRTHKDVTVLQGATKVSESAYIYDGWNLVKEISFDVESYGIGLDGHVQDGQFGKPSAWDLKDGGVQLTGNAWKKIPLDATLTADATLEFDVFIADAGEITCIGFDDNEVWNDAPSGERRFFKLAGSQDFWNFWNTAEGSWVHRSVNVGQYLTGDMSHLILFVDDDADGSADTTFRNIRITTNGKTYKLGETNYLWGKDLSGSMQGAGGVGGLLAVEKEGQNYYPTYDANGNVSEYLAQDGSIAAHYEYDPFGNTADNYTDTVDFAHRFSTKYYDGETAHYYYGYRYYSPEFGRWLSRDPIEENGGINLYQFVGNAPLSAIDVLGMFNRPESGCKKWSVTGSLKNLGGTRPIVFGTGWAKVGFTTKYSINLKVGGSRCPICCKDGSEGEIIKAEGFLNWRIEGQAYGGPQKLKDDLFSPFRYHIGVRGIIRGEAGIKGGLTANTCTGELELNFAGAFDVTARLEVGGFVQYKDSSWLRAEAYGGGYAKGSVSTSLLCNESQCLLGARRGNFAVGLHARANLGRFTFTKNWEWQWPGHNQDFLRRKVPTPGFIKNVLD